MCLIIKGNMWCQLKSRQLKWIGSQNSFPFVSLYGRNQLLRVKPVSSSAGGRGTQSISHRKCSTSSGLSHDEELWGQLTMFCKEACSNSKTPSALCTLWQKEERLWGNQSLGTCPIAGKAMKDQRCWDVQADGRATSVSCPLSTQCT